MFHVAIQTLSITSKLQKTCILNACIPMKSRDEVKAVYVLRRASYFELDKLICKDSFRSLANINRKL